MMDIHDPAYRNVKRWAEERLTKEREKNDALDLDAIQTAHARGRIAMLKELLSLDRVADARARAFIDAPE